MFFLSRKFAGNLALGSFLGKLNDKEFLDSFITSYVGGVGFGNVVYVWLSISIFLGGLSLTLCDTFVVIVSRTQGRFRPMQQYARDGEICGICAIPAGPLRD